VAKKADDHKETQEHAGTETTSWGTSPSGSAQNRAGGAHFPSGHNGKSERFTHSQKFRKKAAGYGNSFYEGELSKSLR
jgi:hypothetical protein